MSNDTRNWPVHLTRASRLHQISCLKHELRELIEKANLWRLGRTVWHWSCSWRRDSWTWTFRRPLEAVNGKLLVALVGISSSYQMHNKRRSRRHSNIAMGNIELRKTTSLTPQLVPEVKFWSSISSYALFVHTLWDLLLLNWGVADRRSLTPPWRHIHISRQGLYIVMQFDIDKTLVASPTFSIPSWAKQTHF